MRHAQTRTARRLRLTPDTQRPSAPKGSRLAQVLPSHQAHTAVAEAPFRNRVCSRQHLQGGPGQQVDLPSTILDRRPSTRGHTRQAPHRPALGSSCGATSQCVSGHVIMMAPAACTSKAFNSTHECHPIGGPIGFDSQSMPALPAPSRDMPPGRKLA